MVKAAKGRSDDYYNDGGSSGVHTTFGEFEIEGNFLEWRDEDTCKEYFVDTSKKCLTYSHHVVCVEVTLSKKKAKGKEFHKIAEAEHQRILGFDLSAAASSTMIGVLYCEYFEHKNLEHRT
ncbi:hypothetical protein CYMTET_14817 [Cymbomonas tetramitiformis]|uniref:Uncharacterized protein n=1 Tax=Cymbomonas tetramitiformis TaxID=36881 RepID=A0AAE0GFB0_9CHLO|nr:hypothetical protein CYMTET_14817 [Cymbomonas tetramitiformis]